jgi:hypothetical protein
MSRFTALVVGRRTRSAVLRCTSEESNQSAVVGNGTRGVQAKGVAVVPSSVRSALNIRRSHKAGLLYATALA